MADLNYLRDITWDEDIFPDWRKNEAGEIGWQETARAKGWPDWETWRLYLAQLLSLPQRAWKLYDFQNPLQDIPQFLVGPFLSWQKNVPEDQINQITFEDFLKLDVERWKTHSKVQALLHQFPPKTQLIGLVEPQSNRIVCIEGIHRCMSVTLAHHEGLELPLTTEIQLALAEMRKDENDLLLRVLHTGTHKPQ